MTKRILILLSCFVVTEAALICAPAQPAIGDSANTVVAVIDSTPLTLGDFEKQRPTALFQARNTFYDTERKAVDDFIGDFLLARQAKIENLTVPQLLEKHVNSTIAKDPSDEALRVYFEGLDVKEPFEAVKGKIADHLRERRIAKAKEAYMLDLRSHAQVAIEVAPPRVQISLDNTPVRGANRAPLTLVEFADYECPYCQQIQPDLDKLEAEYKGKITFAYKDVPLPMHSHAQKAAEAAHCAGVQNKYWEFHDVMLKTKEIDLPQLKQEARAMGLDGASFDTCLDSGSQAGVVKASLDEAQKLGLQGTPSFFLNGRYFSGSMSYDDLRLMVEAELKVMSSKPTETARR